MKHTITHTDNYLLVVDNSEIKKGDFCYDLDGSPGYKNNKFIVQCLRTAIDSYWNKNCKKIIAHLPLNNSPILQGVNLLPNLEQEDDDVEKLADEYVKSQPIRNRSLTNDGWNATGFVEGYNKAKEKYKYTDEDIRKAWNAAYIDAMSIDEETYKPLFFEDFIQSLSQTKIPVSFKCEMDCTLVGLSLADKCKIKTTTNSQGQTVWVGKYIY